MELDGWVVTGDIDLLRLERRTDESLHILLADIKSSTAAKVDHRLQVGFYRAMLRRLFEQSGVEVAEIQSGVLYRGPAEHEPSGAAEVEQRETARRLLGDSRRADRQLRQRGTDRHRPDAYFRDQIPKVIYAAVFRNWRPYPCQAISSVADIAGKSADHTLKETREAEPMGCRPFSVSIAAATILVTRR